MYHNPMVSSVSPGCFYRFPGEQTELDGYVAAECVLCGDIMVQSIDKPLVTPEEQAEQAEQWAL